MVLCKPVFKLSDFDNQKWNYDLTGDARPRFFESSLRFARGAGAARAKR